MIEKAKLIPLDKLRLRREIKEAARLNRDFELYELGKFFATWMISQGGVRVSTMQCTAERVQSWLSVIGLLA